MQLFHEIIFILLFIHISCYCFYEGKASQSFCSTRKVDISEVPEEYQYLYWEYVCCYVWVVVEGKKTEGCFTTSPTMKKDIVGCDSSNTNSDNTNTKGNYNGDTDDDPFIFYNYNEYLLLKIYKIIIFSLLILY